MFEKVKRKHLGDLIIYLQKNYGLYFVEFRRAPNGKDAIVLCNPNNKDWWVHIFLTNRFVVDVNPACTGDVPKSQIRQQIRNKEYIGAGDKFVGKWLKL